jgi:hypothetical protein
MGILEINFEVERPTAGLQAFVAAVHVSVNVKSVNVTSLHCDGTQYKLELMSAVSRHLLPVF